MDDIPINIPPDLVKQRPDPCSLCKMRVLILPDETGYIEKRTPVLERPEALRNSFFLYECLKDRYKHLKSLRIPSPKNGASNTLNPTTYSPIRTRRTTHSCTYQLDLKKLCQCMVEDSYRYALENPSLIGPQSTPVKTSSPPPIL